MSEAAKLYLARLAPSGRRAQRKALDVIAGIVTANGADHSQVAWARLTVADTTVVRQQLVERYAPATARRMLCALRGVLRAAWRLGELDAEQLERTLDFPPVRGAAAPAGRLLDAGEVARALAACEDGTTTGLRDGAALALLFGCGLRRAEAAGLDVADWRRADAVVRVRGKGNKTRDMPADDVGLVGRVDAWLAAYGVEEGPLLSLLDPLGRPTGERISGDALAAIVTRRGRAAGLRGFSPHDCRRYYLTSLLDAGVDVLLVQRLAGHADVRTTARYDRRGDAAARAAATRIELPPMQATDDEEVPP